MKIVYLNKETECIITNINDIKEKKIKYDNNKIIIEENKEIYEKIDFITYMDKYLEPYMIKNKEIKNMDCSYPEDVIETLNETLSKIIKDKTNINLKYIDFKNKMTSYEIELKKSKIVFSIDIWSDDMGIPIKIEIA